MARVNGEFKVVSLENSLVRTDSLHFVQGKGFANLVGKRHMQARHTNSVCQHRLFEAVEGHALSVGIEQQCVGNMDGGQNTEFWEFVVFFKNTMDAFCLRKADRMAHGDMRRKGVEFEFVCVRTNALRQGMILVLQGVH